ncbi:MAG: 3-dehydroquinate synthase [Spirochaetales bacterium]|nr:3-dehydroquinate synthase [Spirochaetales bacterium]
MAIFHVPLKKKIDDSYDIEIGSNLFGSLITDLKNGLIKNVSKYALITDSNVEKLYGRTLSQILKKSGFEIELFTFKAGEASKTRTTKARLEDRLIERRFGRDSCIIALGGGVVTDLAGFIAGTFSRGIPFINYATTLLAAADASIGGKTAVDTPAATNLIGLFFQPKKVYIDIHTWQTLSLRDIQCGLAETIKHACMADAAFFEYLEQHIEDMLDVESGKKILDKTACEHIVRKNCELKYNVVRKDETETNLRQILNLGHTIGRALEPVSKYTLLHGEAVAIGIALQIRLGVKFGYLNQNQAERVVALLKRAGLPTEIPNSINKQTLLATLYTDKKVRKNKIRFVFQKGIGSMMRFKDGSYSREVSEQEIKSVL